MNSRKSQNLKLSVVEKPNSFKGLDLTSDSLISLSRKLEEAASKWSRKAIEIKYIREYEEKNNLLEELKTPKSSRYENCGQFFRVYKCDNCGKKTLCHTFSCNLRICSECCKKQYWRIKGRLWRILEPYGYLRGKYKKFMLREITLTWKEDIQNCNPKTLITDRRKHINKLINHYRKKGIILGSIKVFETKRSSENLTRIHIHSHILTVSRYISQKDLSDKWNNITGNPIVWVKLRRTEQAIGYLLKHIYKPPEILPSDVPLFLEIFEKRRRISTDGILFKVNFTCDKAITLHLICSNCGSELEEFEILSFYQIVQEFRGDG
jgi:hypothetical protein